MGGCGRDGMGRARRCAVAGGWGWALWRCTRLWWAVIWRGGWWLGGVLRGRGCCGVSDGGGIETHDVGAMVCGGKVEEKEESGN